MVVTLAQQEARQNKHGHIGTEHLLMGLLLEEEGLAARVLAHFDFTIESVRAEVLRIVGTGTETQTGQIPFTPRAKKVLELGLREALSLGHNYIGTEHILLGLVRENEGVAVRMLHDGGADAEMIRNEVIRMLSGPGGRRRQEPPRQTKQSKSARDLPEGLGDFIDQASDLFVAVGTMLKAAKSRVEREMAPDVQTYSAAWVRKVVADTLGRHAAAGLWPANVQTTGEWVAEMTDEIMEALG